MLKYVRGRSTFPSVVFCQVSRCWCWWHVGPSPLGKGCQSGRKGERGRCHSHCSGLVSSPVVTAVSHRKLPVPIATSSRPFRAATELSWAKQSSFCLKQVLSLRWDPAQSNYLRGRFAAVFRHFTSPLSSFCTLFLAHRIRLQTKHTVPIDLPACLQSPPPLLRLPSDSSPCLCDYN